MRSCRSGTRQDEVCANHRTGDAARRHGYTRKVVDVAQHALIDNAGNGQDHDGNQRRTRCLAHHNAQHRNKQGHHQEATANTHVT